MSESVLSQMHTTNKYDKKYSMCYIWIVIVYCFSNYCKRSQCTCVFSTINQSNCDFGMSLPIKVALQLFTVARYKVGCPARDRFFKTAKIKAAEVEISWSLVPSLGQVYFTVYTKHTGHTCMGPLGSSKPWSKLQIAFWFRFYLSSSLF